MFTHAVFHDTDFSNIFKHLEEIHRGTYNMSLSEKEIRVVRWVSSSHWSYKSQLLQYCIHIELKMGRKQDFIKFPGLSTLAVCTNDPLL